MHRINNAAVYLDSAPEASIQRAICDYLSYTGWCVVETSQPVRVVNGLIGCPDLIAFKPYGAQTVTLLIEVKAAKGKLRKSQVEFLERIQPMLSKTLWHCVARSVDDVIEMVAVIERSQQS